MWLSVAECVSCASDDSAHGPTKKLRAKFREVVTSDNVPED